MNTARILIATGCALAATSCGLAKAPTTAAHSASASPSQTATPMAKAAVWTTTASFDPASNNVHITETIPGPATLSSAPCGSILHVWLVDASGATVYDTEPSPSPGVAACLAITTDQVAAGQKRVVSVLFFAPGKGTFGIRGEVRFDGTVTAIPEATLVVSG